jgi:LuxR family maltose regulon positive regulatory protein
MSTSILVTKLFIPAARPKLVLRSRLIKKLQEGLHRKVTLISAPAGFGKTTLVNELLQGLDTESTKTAIGWVSLDENDNDSVRFLTYFSEALNRIEGIETNLGKSALGMLGMSQPPPNEVVLTSLINEIAGLTSKILLVLDDYHLIDSQPIHEALNFLLENMPPQLHLVIATREDPPLLLSRLRARNQLTELRAIDLRFTRDEAANFLNQVMGLNLSDEDIAVLAARTEGWIAGLQLAAIALQGAITLHGKDHSTRLIQTFSGSHRLVLDYLIVEVLHQQSEELQDFLLQTSILERLNGSLCDALRFGGAKTPGNTKGQQILENLEHTNLFIIPLDQDRCWYRYHHLFADLLRQRLEQTQPEHLPELHRRASIWYGQQGFRVEAIDHALHSADYARAIELINTDIGGNYEDIALLTLQRWLTAIPDKLITTHPQMLLLKAWHQFNSGQIETADQSLMDVAQLLESTGQLTSRMRAALSGRALAIRSFIASLRGDFAGSTLFARQALDLLPASEQAWRSGVTITLGEACAAQGQIADAQHFRAEALKLSQSAGNPFIIMIANLNLAETLWQQGQIRAVIEICERQMQFATDHDIVEMPIIGWLLGLWGAALAELNQLERALELTRNGAELAKRGQDMFYLSYSYLYRVRVLFAARDWPTAESLLQDMAHIDALGPWITTQISAWQIRIWLAEGKLDVATQWLHENSPRIDGELPFVHEADYVAVARVLLAQGRLDAAADLLARLQGVAEVGGRYLRVIELLLLRALAAQSSDDLRQAQTLLEQAINLGESRGIIRTFVVEGPALAGLLYAALQKDIEPAYVQRILAAFPVAAPQKTEAQLSPETEWLEPLTDRELEILQYVAEGFTNQEIGSRLYLSANTIKTHLRNIYGKLDVNNRTQAVARGRGLGIISDR